MLSVYMDATKYKSHPFSYTPHNTPISKVAPIFVNIKMVSRGVRDANLRKNMNLKKNLLFLFLVLVCFMGGVNQPLLPPLSL